MDYFDSKQYDLFFVSHSIAWLHQCLVSYEIIWPIPIGINVTFGFVTSIVTVWEVAVELKIANLIKIKMEVNINKCS